MREVKLLNNDMWPSHGSGMPNEMETLDTERKVMRFKFSDKLQRSIMRLGKKKQQKTMQ
jgi:hypothetical protein